MDEALYFFQVKTLHLGTSIFNPIPKIFPVTGIKSDSDIWTRMVEKEGTIADHIGQAKIQSDLVMHDGAHQMKV